MINSKKEDKDKPTKPAKANKPCKEDQKGEKERTAKLQTQMVDLHACVFVGKEKQTFLERVKLQHAKEWLKYTN